MWNESLYKIYFIDKTKFNDLYEKRFESENTYKFKFNVHNNPAFFFYHKDILRMISNISFLDKKVTNILNVLPALAKTLYIKKSLIDEILYTNEIEGIISTRKEISEIIDTIKNNEKSKPNKIQSLINKYLMLMDNQHDVTINNCNDVRALYDELVLDDIIAYDPKYKPDGVIFRANSVQVLNEVSGKVMHEGVMPEAKIIDMMSNIINFLNDESVEPVIRIAIFHYIFSYIHPFYDGNGRTNRYISSLYLKMTYNPIIAFRLSLTIKENKKQYYDAFDHTNSKYNKGDITTFVYEFIDIIVKAYEKTYDYLMIKQSELNDALNKLSDMELTNQERNTLWLLYQTEIFKGEKVNIKDISAFIEASEPTTRKVLISLLNKKLIKEEKQAKYKVYSLDSN